jgi:hypothetical protein
VGPVGGPRVDQGLVEGTRSPLEVGTGNAWREGVGRAQGRTAVVQGELRHRWADTGGRHHREERLAHSEGEEAGTKDTGEDAQGDERDEHPSSPCRHGPRSRWHGQSRHELPPSSKSFGTWATDGCDN